MTHGLLPIGSGGIDHHGAGRTRPTQAGTSPQHLVDDRGIRQAQKDDVAALGDRRDLFDHLDADRARRLPGLPIRIATDHAVAGRGQPPRQRLAD
jgi:hypothetical protein